MWRSAVLLVAFLLLGCDREPTSPAVPIAPPLASSHDERHGPPPPRRFGPDTYRVGIFTGHGVTRPGVECGESNGSYRQCDGFVPSEVDRTRLDVTLQIPEGTGPHPLVVLIHGYGGSKNSSGDIARRLLVAGYAVLRYSTRGFGDSWGQVNLADLHAEIADLRSVIGWFADRPRFGIDPDAVAITGASYGGGHSWLALVEPTFESRGGTTVRIRTVVPIVPWSDLLYSLIPNGRPLESVSRPGGLKLSYVNGLYVSGIRDNPQRPYPNYPDYLIGWHAWMNVMEPNEYDPVFRRIESGLAGYRSIWWQRQFWRSVIATRVPILQVQGFTDDLFPLPEAKRMLLALQSLDPGYPIASYFGDIGHPRASNKTGETEYVLDLVEQWLDYYLKGIGSAPPNVIHAAITRRREAPFDPDDVIMVPTYEALATGVNEYASPVPAVLVNPLTDPAGGFFWDPLVMEAARELEPLPVPPESPTVPGSLATYDWPVTSTLLIAGQPTVHFRASTPSHRVQINIRLFDVSPDGTKQLITRGTHTLDGGIPRPIGRTDVIIQSYGNLWAIPAGHILRLEITNVDSPYITPSRVPSTTIIEGVTLEVPVRGS